MTMRSSMMRKLMVLVMAFAVMLAYAVVPMNQAFAASAKKPAKVAGVKAKAQSENKIKITWKKAKNAKKYQVYRASKKTGKFKKIATTKNKYYFSKKLKANKKYFYKVRAINGKKKGAFSKVAAAKTKKKANRKVFVSASYVKKAIADKDPDLVVAEVSWGPDAPEKVIPGAIHVNTDDLEMNGQDLGYEQWDLRGFDDNYKTLIKALAGYGITTDTELICYGDGETNSGVTRLAMAALMCGVKHVKVMNGGTEAWTKAGNKMAAVSKAKAAKSFGRKTALHPDWVISTADMVNKVKSDSNFKLVSIRSYDEFIGKNSGYAYIDKAGEPEGAIWGRDTDDGSYFANGKTVGIDKIDEYLKPYGASTKNELAFYCGTGWRATIPFLICYEAGIDNMKLWDDGWFVYSGAYADKWNWVDGDPAAKKPVVDYPVQIGDPLKGNVEKTMVSKLEPVYNPLRGDIKVKSEKVEAKVGAPALESNFEIMPAAKEGITNSVKFTSSDESVATVDNTGKVTVVKAGTVTITAEGKASFGSTPDKAGTHKSASYTLTVTE